MRTGQAIMSEVQVLATQVKAGISDLPWRFKPTEDELKTLKALHTELGAYFKQVKSDC